MSLNASAIRKCIRQVLEGEITGVRAITPGLLSCDIAEGATDETISGRVLAHASAGVTNGLALVAIAYPPSADAIMGPGPTVITGIEVTITLTYLLNTQALGAEFYSSPKESADAVAHAITVAFIWPGKLAATITPPSQTAVDPTGIVNGYLTGAGWTVVRDDAPQSGQVSGGGLFQIQNVYTGTVVTTESTT